MSQQNVSKMEKVKADWKNTKKNKRNPANSNEPKLKSVPGKKVAQ